MPHDAAELTLDHASDPEYLLETYGRLAARGGPAAGPDGIRPADLGPREAAEVARDLSAVIRRGGYRPAGRRRVQIPKVGRPGHRTIAVPTLADRLVSSALHGLLDPVVDRSFLPGSYGFRRGRGTWDLLADLGRTMARVGLYTLAVDDVGSAFDLVPIAAAMEGFREHVSDPGLLALIETAIRGGEDGGRAVGIHQGDPLSPLCLNVVLHKAHDAPLAGRPGSPPWYRYADNLAYLCPGVPEGRRALDDAARLMADAGLALKGEDGPPVDLRRGEAKLLGFDLSWRGGHLELGSGRQAFAALDRRLAEAHLEPDPPASADMVVAGWLGSMGPALVGDRGDRAVTRIAPMLSRHGFREISIAGLRRLARSSADRWLVRRDLHMGEEAGASRGLSSVALGPPAPSVSPGVPARAPEASAG